MSATYYYQVYIGNTEPSRPNLGSIWIRCALGQVCMRIGREWIQIAGAEPIVNYTEGYSYQSLAVQASAPTAVIGKLWFETDTGQTYIYLTDWILVMGV